jgi:hypothetical protein
MEHYKFTGTIKIIIETQTFKNNFKKREVVLTSDEEYPQDIKFEFTDENGINALDKYMEGELVTVAFVLRGNEYQGKYYTSNKAIAIGDAVTGTKETKKQVEPKKVETETFEEEFEDDLPF